MDLIHAIFERAPDAHALVDDVGRVIRVNGAARALFGEAKSLDRIGELDRFGPLERPVRVLGHDGRVHDLLVRRVALGDGVHLIAARELPQPGRRIDTPATHALSAIHDLNNFLTPIAAYASAVELETTNARHQEMAHDIVAATVRAAQIVRGVLESVRAAAPVSVNEVVTGLRSLIERIIGPDVQLELACDAQHALTCLDSLELERALLNLVSNARDAMGPRGRLTIETGNVERPLAEDGHRGSFVMLRVRDTGVGMSEAVRSHVLERPATHKVDGCGLGLVTVRRLIASSGGFFTIESAEGQGTSIALFFRVWTS